jgi:hypothetical protein
MRIQAPPATEFAAPPELALRLPQTPRGHPSGRPAREQTGAPQPTAHPTQYRPAPRHSRPGSSNTDPHGSPQWAVQGLACSSRGNPATAHECQSGIDSGRWWAVKDSNFRPTDYRYLCPGSILHVGRHFSTHARQPKHATKLMAQDFRRLRHFMACIQPTQYRPPCRAPRA